MNLIDELIEKLLLKIKSYAPLANIELIKKAALFADKSHQGQKRLSGDPFITHPAQVAQILTELEQDTSTIAAALLHDTIEDGKSNPDELKKEFGPQITALVHGVTKLGQITFESKEERQAENFRKMFLAMGEDIRVIIIKLADRLHNMQTLKYLPLDRQKDISVETLEIFTPLAHRLGMWKLKWELEDLAFFYLERDKFDQIKNLVAQKREAREEFMKDFMAGVKEALEKVGINAAISGRTKHFYSIYNKLVKKNIDFDDVYDLIAIRVIVDSVKDCYAVLGIVHSHWKPIPGRFRDFIAMPKSNGYQSLHTTVVGPLGRPVEIQIRTKEMHRIAEYGIAAHWRYKEGATDKTFDSKLAWLRQTLEYQKDVDNAKDFLENIKFDLLMDEVYVYTPKGDVFAFPVGSTPLDFAYHIHSEIGNRYSGAKINGKIVSLDYHLKNGDIVEILTMPREAPSLDWLKIVKSAGARAKIKQWFKKQKKEENVVRGRKTLEEELKKIEIPDFSRMTDPIIQGIFKNSNIAASSDLFLAIGRGEISAPAAANKIRSELERRKLIPSLVEEKDLALFKPREIKEVKMGHGIKVMGEDNILTRFSKCCYPLPGDEIVGVLTKGRGVSIHRADCKNAKVFKASKEKTVNVEWAKDSIEMYPVNIEVKAFDRVGVFKDILSQVTETNTNVDSAQVRTKKGSIAFIDLVVDVKNTENLSRIIDSIRKVSDVYDVYRT